MVSDRDMVSYVLSSLGCAHPFRISRILLLADWQAVEGLGRRLSNLTYVMEEFGFYVEELTEIVEELQSKGCLVKVEERKCLKYTCGPPDLSGEVKAILDEVIEETSDMDDRKLNRLVLSDPRYGRDIK